MNQSDSESHRYQVLVKTSLFHHQRTSLEDERNTGTCLQEKKTHLQQEEKRDADSADSSLQPYKKRDILLLKKKPHAQNKLKREYHFQVSEDKTLLDVSEEKENHLVEDNAYLQTKECQLLQDLKETHFQQRQIKKQASSDEKSEPTCLPKNTNNELGWQRESKGKRRTTRRHKQNFMWVKSRHSFCLPKPSAVCSSFRPRISRPSPLVQGQVGIKGEDRDFKAWLKSKGEDEACPTLMIGRSSHGRGLFASRPILAGESILRISSKLVITPDNIHDDLKDLLGGNVSNCARLALFILSEQYAGKASEWAPYMNCLPQLGTLHNTVLWSDTELELLCHNSRAYRQSVQSRAIIYQEFASVQHVLQRCPHLFGPGVSCADFLHAYAVVSSRAWGVDEGNTVGLVPFVDFLNHDTSCQSFLSFDNSYTYAEVVADRDYTCGEQVFLNYGKYGNDVLATTFGFTLEFNPFEQVEVWISLHRKDPLFRLRLELLQTHGMPMLPGSAGADEWGNVFHIREVKSLKGRGKGIPQSLRAFARVLCANSEQELIDMAKQASQLDGRLAREPYKDVRKELQAMTLLLTQLESLIQDHIAAIMALEMAYFCNVSRGSVPCIRKKMAEDILDGEVRILRSAANWLKYHCIALNSLL